MSNAPTFQRKRFLSWRKLLSWRLFTRFMRGLCAAVLAAYLYFYIYQESWILEPHKKPTDYEEKKDFNPELGGLLMPPNRVLLPMNDSLSSSDPDIHTQKLKADGKSIPGIHVQKFKAKGESARGVVVYFHGNRGNLYQCRSDIEPFVDAGYDVWTMDYRSFGRSSEGPVNETVLVEDAEMFYKYVLTQPGVKEHDVVLWGRSFGSGIAASVAANNSPRLLVLETPYCSIPDQVRSTHWYLPPFLIRYRLPTYECLAYVDCPVHLIHGTDDERISFASSERLKKRCDELKLLVDLHRIEGGVHNLRKASTFTEFSEKLKKVLSEDSRAR